MKSMKKRNKMKIQILISPEIDVEANHLHNKSVSWQITCIASRSHKKSFLRGNLTFTGWSTRWFTVGISQVNFRFFFPLSIRRYFALGTSLISNSDSKWQLSFVSMSIKNEWSASSNFSACKFSTLTDAVNLFFNRSNSSLSIRLTNIISICSLNSANIKNNFWFWSNSHLGGNSLWSSNCPLSRVGVRDSSNSCPYLP